MRGSGLGESEVPLSAGPGAAHTSLQNTHTHTGNRKVSVMVFVARAHVNLTRSMREHQPWSWSKTTELRGKL